jgi:predicted nucleotidyltransferase
MADALASFPKVEISLLSTPAQSPVRHDQSYPLRIFRAMGHLSTIKAILEQLKPKLAAKYHVQTLALFGSVVRDDFNAGSDVDILIDFSAPIGIEFIDLADYIERKLNRRVDLVSRKAIKEPYYRAIEGDIVYV